MKQVSRKCISFFLLIFLISNDLYAFGMTRKKVSPPKPTSNTSNAIAPSTTIPKSPDSQYVEYIKSLAGSSTCAKYSWKNRGRAPQGFIKGVALSFARSLCRLKKGDDNSSLNIHTILARASGSSQKDALSHYSSQMQFLDLKISEAGEEPLKAVYLLGFGLGMRESSGKYCTGWDTSAGSNRSSSAAEAGVFQVSYDSIGASSELIKLYREYQSSDSSRCLLSTFKEGVSCGSSSTLGSGGGAEFQKFVKSCPAFATEYAMVLLRILRKHFGPINRKEAEVISSCNNLLNSIQDIIERDTIYACTDID
jgi:hypothetical protein